VLAAVVMLSGFLEDSVDYFLMP